MKERLAHAFLRLHGFRVEGEAPPYDKFVMIAAPHTSNWDFPFMMAVASVLDVDLRWMGKHTLFAPPWGRLARQLGGIPIVRHERHNVVDQMVDLVAREEKLALAVPAEGTRGRTDHWKSGFYHIARRAGVPVVLSYLDYGERRSGVGPAIQLTGHIRSDMEVIRSFYAGMKGKFPERQGPIRLREEDGLEAANAA